MAFPGFDKCFHVGKSGSHGVAYDNVSVNEAVAAFRGELAVDVIRAHWAGGAPKNDALPSGYAISMLISDRGQAVLRQAGITGWTTIPCILSSLRGKAFTDYSFFVVTGRCGEISDALSRPDAEGQRMVEGNARAVRGLYFAPTTWDGSDFFLPGKSVRLFCTDRAKSAMTRARLRGLNFTPLDSVQRLLFD